MSLAKVYKNISFERLGQLLQIPDETLEQIVARMISANLLRASIDQIERTITFNGRFSGVYYYLVLSLKSTIISLL